MSPNVSELQRLQDETAEDVARIAAEYICVSLRFLENPILQKHCITETTKKIFNMWANPLTINKEDSK